MLKAYSVTASFPALVELTEQDRHEIAKDVILAAEEADKGEDHTAVFNVEFNGKLWKVYVSVGHRRVNIVTPAEAKDKNFPGADL